MAIGRAVDPFGLDAPVEQTKRRMTRRWFTVGLFVAGVVESRPVFALNDGDKEAVRQLANDAAAEYDKGRYESARTKFLRAFAIAKVPRLAVRAARAHEKLGMLVSAYELYRQALGLVRNDLWSGTVQEEAQADARTELAALKPRLARLAIQIEGADPGQVELSVDGVKIPGELVGVARYVDPGERRVHGQIGEREAEARATLAEGQLQEVVLRFAAEKGAAVKHAGSPKQAKDEPSAKAEAPKRDDTASGSGQRTWGWVGLGVGVAGLSFGATTGVLALVRYGDLKDNCPDKQCHADYQGKVASYDTLRTMSSIGLIAGGVCAVAGLTLILTSPKPQERRVGVWISPGTVAVGGAF
jgi:hypothetical protein